MWIPHAQPRRITGSSNKNKNMQRNRTTTTSPFQQDFRECLGPDLESSVVSLEQIASFVCTSITIGVIKWERGLGINQVLFPSLNFCPNGKKAQREQTQVLIHFQRFLFYYEAGLMAKENKIPFEKRFGHLANRNFKVSLCSMMAGHGVSKLIYWLLFLHNVTRSEMHTMAANAA